MQPVLEKKSKEHTPLVSPKLMQGLVGEMSPMSHHGGAKSPQLAYMSNSPRHMSVLDQNRGVSSMDKAVANSKQQTSEDDDPAESTIE